MLLISSTALGISLIVFGVVCYLAVSQLLSRAARSSNKPPHAVRISHPVHLPEHDDAYILVGSGGRVLFTNALAKEWFGLNGKKNNLEVLVAGLRPQESFFALCSREGKARFKLGERLIEGNSYQIPYESDHAMVISLRGIQHRENGENGSTKSPIFKYNQVRITPDPYDELDETEDELTIEGMNNGLEYAGGDSETWDLTQELEKRVEERTQELKFEHQRTAALLRITTELSSSLDSEQILQRTLEVLNEVIGASHATCMVLQRGKTKLRHLATVGNPTPLPQGGLPSILDTDQGLVGWIIANHQSVLIDDVLEDERWIQLPLSWYQHRSAVGSPIMIGNQLLGVLLLYYPEVGHFSEQQLDLIQAAANQMAVAIKNAELFNLTRDQKEELSDLLIDQKIETSRSHSILEAIADGVLVTDQLGNITLFNHSIEKMLDLNREDVIGRPIEHFSKIFSGSTNSWLETIKAWWKKSASLREGTTFSEQISLDNGSVLSVNLAPVMNNNEFYGTVSVLRDITHLIEVDRLKSEFVATVSHELRTPMTSIKGYVDIMLMGVSGEMSDQQLRFLKVVQQNTERLTILVNDLLDLSRIEAGQVNLERLPVELQKLIEEALEEIQRVSMTESKSLQMKIDIPADLPSVSGDPDRVRQILINLLSNAYYYTPPDGQIYIQARCVGEEIQVDIQDTGVGIPPKEQDRIFERLYRGDNHMVYASSGTGLGLSIVQKLIQMHHGRIWVQSSGIPGEGSIFSFTLPIYDHSQIALQVREEYAENTNC